MLIEKMNAIFPLCHRIFFQPFPIFSSNIHITTAENGTIMITFSIHSVVSFCSPFTVSQMVNAPYQVPYKLKAASAALLHCFFGFLTTSGNFFDHGSRSSKNDRSLSSMRLGISVRRCSKYSYGFRLFAFAVSAML